MSAHTGALQQLYVAYFSRPADPGGLAFWEGVMAAPGVSIARVSTEFAQQPEYTNEYAGLDAYGIVNRVYHNLFGRAADDAGLRFWGDQLAAKPAMISQIVLAIAGGGNHADGSRNADGVAFDNKVRAAIAYADATNADPLLHQAANQPAMIDSSRAFLAAVTSTASLGAALDPAALNTTLVAMAMAQGATAGGVVQAVTTPGAAVTVGADGQTSDPIWVTHAAQGGAAIAIDGGSSVTVSSSGSTTGSSIVVGAHQGATGAVSVTSAYTDGTGIDYVWAIRASLADISVTGGTSIEVNQSAASTLAATNTAAMTVKMGAVNITGGANTTAVSSTQTFFPRGEVAAVKAVAGAFEIASVKFGALKADDTLTIDSDADGVSDADETTFTAGRNLTAPEAAAALEAVVTGDRQSYGSATYANTNPIWTSAAASGDTVKFTSTEYVNAYSHHLIDLAFVLTNTSGSSVAPVVTTTDSVRKVVGVTGRMGIDNSTVVINDNGANASITSVSVDGYEGANNSIGAVNSLTNLENLSLAHSAGLFNSDAISVDAAGITSLKLSVNSIVGIVNLDAGGASIKTLNLTATGADSMFIPVADALETLLVSGDKVAALMQESFGTMNPSSGTDLKALKTVVVTGGAGVALDAPVADTLASVDTSGTTGTVTATIEGARATYTGGAGQDIVTLAKDTVVSKAIRLGAGDDTLSFAELGVTGATAVVDGGAGADTLEMTTATAAAWDDTTTLSSQFTGFERLSLQFLYVHGGPYTIYTIDLAKLGGFNYVTMPQASRPLTLNNLPSGGMIAPGHENAVTVGVTGAAAGKADVLNVALCNWRDSMGTLTVPDVENINLTATNFDTNERNSYRLSLAAADATHATITGDGSLILSTDYSTKLASIDGSRMTGELTFFSYNDSSATTIKGGSGNDYLMAGSGLGDVLIGGAGDDMLFGGDRATGNRATLSGGAGADKFSVGRSLDSSHYVTITDFTAGEVIQIFEATAFVSAKITQGAAAVFQDYLDASMRATASGNMTWFQYKGDTYLALDLDSDSSTFVDGQDSVVKLTGLMDLTHCSLRVPVSIWETPSFSLI